MIHQFHLKELKAGTPRYLHTNVQSSIIYNCQEVETTQMSINKWMDFKNVIYRLWNIILPW
jgi:hypothetical protein